MSEETKVYRARKIYRPDGSLLDNGAVVCRAGRIAAVGAWPEIGKGGLAVEDLGDVLMLPGLINAHTHLRLSHLKGGDPTDDFVGWLGKMAMQARFTRTATFTKAIEDGARELLETGTTTAVDVDIDALAATTLRESPLRLVFAHECIHLDPERAEKKAAEVMERAAGFEREPWRREHGVAPHAPYSVSRELFESLSRRLQSQPCFLTIHVAECADEIEMIAAGEGRIVKWLRMFRVLPRDWQPPRCTPVAYLDQTGILATAGVAAHCGLASEADAALLARRGWTVAFCPGTHAFFGRPPYPLERFRRAGVAVCIATDSAASNTSLSLMDEMRRVARDFHDLPAAEIVAMATTIPARAIGWGDAVGQLEPGFCADLSVWSPCPDGDRLDRAWLEGEPPDCAATAIGGRVVYRRQPADR